MTVILSVGLSHLYGCGNGAGGDNPAAGPSGGAPGDAVVVDEPCVIEIKKLGGNVGRDTNRPEKPVIGVFLGNSPQITDDSLELLLGLPEITHLGLGGTSITDSGLEQIARLKKLTFLFLGGTKVTGDGLIFLKDLDQLKEVYLSGSPVTDASLVQIEELSHLEKLWLDNTEVTDAGLQHFKKMTNLRELHLDETQVSDEAIAELTEALPDLKVSK